MAKTLSSRVDGEEDPSNLEILQEMVFTTFDLVGIDDEPADTMDEVVDQLEEGLMHLAEKHETLEVAFAAVTTDFLQATLANDSLARELTVAAVLLEAMAAPPWVDELMEKSMSILRRDGQAQVDLVADDQNSIELRTRLTFDEDQLREALRVAINEYNHNLAEGILTGAIKFKP